MWFEEPVSSDDLDGLRAVREAVRPGVAAGEYGYDLTYFRRMVHGRRRGLPAGRRHPMRRHHRMDPRRGRRRRANLEISGHCAPSCTSTSTAATPNLRHLE